MRTFCQNVLRTVAGLFIAMSVALPMTNQAAPSFTIGDNDFLLDGKPFLIRCGEMHFARIPREYWHNTDGKA